MKTSKKGISLIVLVITIIVMIILATAIILSLNSSDIIGKANEAVSKNDIANAKSVVSLAMAEWELEGGAISGYDEVTEYAKAKLAEAGFKTEGHGGLVPTKEGGINTIYVGSDNRQAIIPEGFVASDIKTEDTVTEGLVIKDKGGNEFVWIPVDDFTKFARTTTYNGTITVPGTNYTEPFSETYNGITLPEANDLTGEYAEEAKMRESVKENNGFYIARYEAGLPEGKNVDTVTSTDKPISKKGATVWNYIPWGTNMTEVGTEGAVYRARQMYRGSKSVVSTLCYGVQWDAALQFIATKDAEYPTNSTGKGYYAYDEESNQINPEEVQVTGSNDEYAVNNIYDMAGNIDEWTMEAYSTEVRVVRGGSYFSSGSFSPASYRNDNDPGISNDNYGFRLTLYIK